MKHTIDITIKEFRDMLRDKRTIITMIAVPLLLFPVIMGLTGTIATKQHKKEQTASVKVGVLSAHANHNIVQKIEDIEQFIIKEFEAGADFEQLVKDGKIDIAVQIINADDNKQDNSGDVKLSLVYQSTKNVKRNLFMDEIKKIRSSIVETRLDELQIDKSYIHPIPVKFIDVADEKQKLGSVFGGLIPYIFILFCYIGALYPSIDLFAGEKERGTVETLLSLPVSRMELLSGKLIVVWMSSVVSALLSIFGLFIALKTASFMPGDIASAINSILSPSVIIRIIIMLLPLSLFIATILVILSTYARNYKEAQSLISPLMIFIIIPAVIAGLPGVEMNLPLSFIPIFNVSLSTKEIISGTINHLHYVFTIVSLLAFAGVGAWMCSKWYLRESNFLRV